MLFAVHRLQLQFTTIMEIDQLNSEFTALRSHV